MAKKIGIALAGGGARGAYQIGAWKALKERGIDKDIVAYSGASVGSLNAVLFAMGDYDKAVDVWMSLDRGTVFKLEKKIYKRIFKEKLNFLNRGVLDTKKLEKMMSGFSGKSWTDPKKGKYLVRDDLRLASLLEIPVQIIVGAQ